MTRSEHGATTVLLQPFVAHLKRNFRSTCWKSVCRTMLFWGPQDERLPGNLAKDVLNRDSSLWFNYNEPYSFVFARFQTAAYWQGSRAVGLYHARCKLIDTSAPSLH